MGFCVTVTAQNFTFIYFLQWHKVIYSIVVLCTSKCCLKLGLMLWNVITYTIAAVKGFSLTGLRAFFSLKVNNTIKYAQLFVTNPLRTQCFSRCGLIVTLFMPLVLSYACHFYCTHLLPVKFLISLLIYSLMLFFLIANSCLIYPAFLVCLYIPVFCLLSFSRARLPGFDPCIFLCAFKYSVILCFDQCYGLWLWWIDFNMGGTMVQWLAGLGLISGSVIDFPNYSVVLLNGLVKWNMQ